MSLMTSTFATNSPRSMPVQTTSAIFTEIQIFCCYTPSSHAALILLSVLLSKAKTLLRQCILYQDSLECTHCFRERIKFSLEIGRRFLTEERRGSEPSHIAANLEYTSMYGHIREPDVSENTSILKKSQYISNQTTFAENNLRKYLSPFQMSHLFLSYCMQGI